MEAFEKFSDEISTQKPFMCAVCEDVVYLDAPYINEPLRCPECLQWELRPLERFNSPCAPRKSWVIESGRINSG